MIDPGNMPPSELEGYAGQLYADLIQEQLVEERARKDSLERRGLVVLGTSAVSLAILLLSSVLWSGDFLGPEVADIALVGASASALLTAVIASLFTNWPRRYAEPAPDELLRLTEERFWAGRTSIASKRLAELRIKVLTSARINNSGKERALRMAMLAQVIGASLAAALTVAFVAQ